MNLNKRLYAVFASVGILMFGVVTPALAHCPLCTAGAGLAAVGAKYLGVGTAPIGVFIGAFGVAMGLWISNLLRKKYIPHQAVILATASLALTVIPLLPLMPGLLPFYVSIGGEYGSLLNRTYTINLFLLGSLIGGILLAISPYFSRTITKMRRGKFIPFQGLAITFLLLICTSIILELWIS